MYRVGLQNNKKRSYKRVANTSPESIPSSVKRFTDKTLLSLKFIAEQSWLGFYQFQFIKKWQFMDKFTSHSCRAIQVKRPLILYCSNHLIYLQRRLEGSSLF